MPRKELLLRRRDARMDRWNRQLIVIVAAAAVAAGNTLELEVRDVDVPAGPRELHQRYSEIFRYGNRNAALTPCGNQFE